MTALTEEVLDRPTATVLVIPVSPTEPAFVIAVDDATPTAFADGVRAVLDPGLRASTTFRDRSARAHFSIDDRQPTNHRALRYLQRGRRVSEDLHPRGTVLVRSTSDAERSHGSKGHDELPAHVVRHFEALTGERVAVPKELLARVFRPSGLDF